MRYQLLPIVVVSGLVLGGMTLPSVSPIPKQERSAGQILLEETHLEAGKSDDRLFIKLSKPVAPRLRFVASEECWQVDLPNVCHTAEPVLLAGLGSTIRLVRSMNVEGTPAVLRLSLFVKPGVGLKVIPQDKVLVLSLIPGMMSSSPGHASAGLHAASPPNGLLAPGVVKEEIVIALERSGPLPLLGELARRAGIEIRFRDAPPASVSCRGTAPNPLAALQMLAGAMGMVVDDEGDAWRFSHRNNPLLKISAREMIDGGDIDGLTLRQALTRLAGKQRGESWSNRLGDSAERCLRGFTRDRVSARMWVERLLNAHGFDPTKGTEHG